VVVVGEEEGAQVDVVVGCLRAVDDDGPEDALGVLDRVVGVVLARAVLRRLLAVCVAVSEGNWTYRLGGGAACDVSIKLAGFVEVDACHVAGNMVAHADLDVVAPVGLNDGAGILALDCHHDLVHAIPSEGCMPNIEVVLPSDARVGPGVSDVRVDVKAAPALTGCRRVLAVCPPVVNWDRTNRNNSREKGMRVPESNILAR
jgi:hypothetical protein